MEESHKLELHYIKGNEYRTNYVTGFYGGITHQNKFHLSYYLERPPLPRTGDLTFTTDEKGNLKGKTKETPKDSKSGIVRETQGGLIMDIGTAKTLRDWITKHINDYESTKMEFDKKK